MIVACIDLEKACYDTVQRDKLWQVLEDYGINSGKLMGAVRAFYEKSEAYVRIKEIRCQFVFLLQEE